MCAKNTFSIHLSDQHILVTLWPIRQSFPHTYRGWGLWKLLPKSMRLSLLGWLVHGVPPPLKAEVNKHALHFLGICTTAPAATRQLLHMPILWGLKPFLNNASCTYMYYVCAFDKRHQTQSPQKSNQSKINEHSKMILFQRKLKMITIVRVCWFADYFDS